MKNKTITDDIYQVNDGLFHKIFDNPENTRDFLERVLPDELKNQLDLENIEIEDTKKERISIYVHGFNESGI